MAQRPPLKDRPVVFLDTETTGLDELEHEIIEIAFIDGNGDTLLHTAVKPEHIETASPYALEINGYNEGEWAPSPWWKDIAAEVHRLLQGVVIVGQNVQFDMRFINRSLKRYFVAQGLDAEQVDAEMKKVGYHLIDTVTLSWEHLAPAGLRSLSLAAVCDFLGVENPGEHSALWDARTTRRVYEILLRAGTIQRIWWSIVGPRRAKRAYEARKRAREAAAAA
jgi:DNA polymerase III epsilon subunit-like protein